MNKLNYPQKFLLFFVFFLMTITTTFAQGGTIKGVVKTSDDKPAEGVTVSVKGTGLSQLTDDRGFYEIKKIKSGNYTIKVSAIGYYVNERSIYVNTEDELVENFVINTKTEGLNEVLVESKKANKFTKSETEFVSKIQLKNIENSQVYSIVTKELMTDQMITNQDDALKNVPGVYQLWASTGRIGDGGSYFASRGFVTQSLIRNGVASTSNGSSDASNIERVESIKGPSATLFGSILTSYGGLINRVTKKPFDTFGGEVNFQTGSYSFNRLSADINTPLNEDKTALFRTNLAYNNSDTFQDNGTSKNYFFSTAFDYKFNDRLSVSLETEINNSEGTGIHLIYFWDTPNTLGFNKVEDLKYDFKRSFNGSNFITKGKSTNIFGQVNYKLSNTWNSQSIITTINNSTEGPGTWLYLLADNKMSRNAWKFEGKTNTIEFQQNFTGDFKIGSVRNRVLAGGDIYYYLSKINTTIASTGSYAFDTVDYTAAVPNYGAFNQSALEQLFANSPYIYKYDTNFVTHSAYISDVTNITDRLIVSAGVRFDNYENKGVYDPATNTTTGTFSQNAFSPKFGIVYQIVKDQVSVFGNYQNSFKNQGYLNANVNGNLELKKFNPEQANQLEAGIKVNAFSNKLIANISYYNIKVTDVVRVDSKLANANIQDGNQLSKGVEIEIISNPIPGLNFTIGYAFNKSELEKADPNVNGLRPITAGPENLANFWINYTVQNKKLKGLGIGFGGNHAGESLIYNQNILDSTGTKIGVETFSLSSYTVLNSTIFYDQPKYRFALKVNNLTDELYFNGYSTINVQAPRTFMGSISYKF